MHCQNSGVSQRLRVTLGGSQNDSPPGRAPLNIGCRNIIYNQKGPMLFGTTFHCCPYNSEDSSISEMARQQHGTAGRSAT